MTNVSANPAFDPEACPLLRGLSPAEQKQRMEQDPIIRGCIQAVDKGTGQSGFCRSEASKARIEAKVARQRKQTTETA
jgi:hypothetical protein